MTQQFTTGHCENAKMGGGCPLHNLQCQYPDCDRRPITPAIERQFTFFADDVGSDAPTDPAEAERIRATVAEYFRNPRHELRCDKEPFQAILDGTKRYEVRVNDRGYRVGDVLELNEQDANGWTGRTCYVNVLHMIQGVYGLPPELCVMSIELRDRAPLKPGGPLVSAINTLARVHLRGDNYGDPTPERFSVITGAMLDYSNCHSLEAYVEAWRILLCEKQRSGA